MPEYLSPGVYVEEVSGGVKPIEGVSTSTAGFVGRAERGPESPRLITNFLDFQRWYGGYVPDDSYLTYAVEGFFANGGKRCFVTRVVYGAAAVAATGNSGTFQVAAIGRGAWGNDVKIVIAAASQAADQPDWFRLEIYYQNDLVTIYDDLTHQAGASNNVITRINSTSRLVRVCWDGDPAALVPGEVELQNGSDDGDEDEPGVGDFRGDLDPIPIGPGVAAPDELLGRGRGLAALGAIDEISLLIVPDEVRQGLATITGDVVTQCEKLKDRFGIVSVAQGASDAPGVQKPYDTSYAAFYYPWIEIFDPAANYSRLVPASGHVAGIFARTDVERGVHKAPANAVVRGATHLEFPVTKGMQDILNPKGINAIRDFRSDGRGIRLWGARTMSSDPEWKYVNVRRLFIFIEESIDEGTQWVVFEPNDEPTWAAVRRSVGNFLITVWRSGALMGTTQDEAFFVKCDRTTMTQDDIDNGRLICLIGIAAVKPAEFVIFRISQKTADAA